MKCLLMLNLIHYSSFVMLNKRVEWLNCVLPSNSICCRHACQQIRRMQWAIQRTGLSSPIAMTHTWLATHASNATSQSWLKSTYISLIVCVAWLHTYGTKLYTDKSASSNNSTLIWTLIGLQANSNDGNTGRCTPVHWLRQGHLRSVSHSTC